MLHYPKDTLAYHNSRPMLRIKSIADVQCSVISQAFNNFRANHTADAVPEVDAFEYYQLNHAFALISQRRLQHEPLPADELALVNDFFDTCNVSAQRALYYILLICTREARWLNDKSAWKGKLTALFGAECAAWVSSIDDGAQVAMKAFGTNPPKCTMGQYVSALREVFYQGKWNGGYGGKAWGAITDVLHNFVQGTTSLQIMLDNTWELCHNNGPIFNKSMLYKHHHGTTLVTILDVQNAGMIPTLLHDTPHIVEFAKTDKLAERNARLMAMFPDLPKVMDWEQVEKLGADQTYGHMKNNKNGEPKPKANKKKKTGPNIPNAAKVDLTKCFEVHPGMVLSKVARAA